jgi:hypothetical protein
MFSRLGFPLQPSGSIHRRGDNSQGKLCKWYRTASVKTKFPASSKSSASPSGVSVYSLETCMLSYVAHFHFFAHTCTLKLDIIHFLSFLCVFEMGVSLCHQGWPWTLNPPSSTSQGLASEVWSTSVSFNSFLN